MQENDRRIARNTLFLYGRMLVTVWISLYTSRIVLEQLGVDDYGVYTLVGGIVTILSFLNGTMSAATSRFISYELGAGDPERLRRTFGASMRVHLTLAGIVLLLAETAGLWYVNHHLVIAPERMAAANATYQLSILAAMATIVQVPYMASIMSHERMDAYAGIAVANVVLKFLAALGIALFATSDTLVGYASLMALAAIAVCGMYAFYARHHFPACRSIKASDRATMRAMLGFCGWDSYGNLCFTARSQGTLVVLNHFGGTVLNAAGGLTLTVSGTIGSFAGSVVSAFRPQIVKEYAARAYDRVLTLLNNAACYSLLLMGLLIVPAIVEMDTLLGLWLVDVPAYTVVFCRISLIAACGELLNTVAAIGIHATGRVFRISFISGSLYLLELPLMWLLLRSTGMPPVVYCVHACAVTGILLVNTLILKYQMPEFSVWSFWLRGVLKPAVLIAVTFGAVWIVAAAVQGMWLRLLSVGATTLAVLGALAWAVILPRSVKQPILNKFRR
ncbi:MAG: polysaccharide biosynthesis protein [Muribaculaceae bacterium]|nr:polysaccharide biosynthesis protein [Muribaculaceae bacterium]